MDELILAIIKWIVPFVCGGAATWVSVGIKRLKADEKGLQCLLRSEIIRYHDKYVERGYCPVYAKESLSRMYRAYVGLHGNDVATSLYKVVMELPTEPPKSDVK